MLNPLFYHPAQGRHSPAVASVSADQLDHFARVADGPVGEQEQQAGVSAARRLSQDPGERRQDVGAPHVGSDLPDVLARQGHGLLGLSRRGGEHEKKINRATKIENATLHVGALRLLIRFLKLWKAAFGAECLKSFAKEL